MKNVYIVLNQNTKKMDVIDRVTLEPYHEGLWSLEDVKATLAEEGHTLLVGAIVHHPYLGRLREARYRAKQ